MVKLYFSCATSAWLAGKALAMGNPEAKYSEPTLDCQVLEGKRIVIDLKEFNQIIQTIPLIDAGKYPPQKVGGVVVIPSAPSDEFMISQEEFRDTIKPWARKIVEEHPEIKIVEETETRIVLED